MANASHMFRSKCFRGKNHICSILLIHLLVGFVSMFIVLDSCSTNRSSDARRVQCALQLRTLLLLRTHFRPSRDVQSSVFRGVLSVSMKM